ncbi:MAG: YceI family protein [Longimicrobiales bacterium]
MNVAPPPRCAALALLGAFAAVPGATGAQEFHVDTDADNRVVFISRASIEEFEGVTDRIDGYALLDGDGVRPGTAFDGARLYFEVDLASLDTGIGLRNRHMRENYLEVEEHPYATFAGTVARIVDTADGLRVESDGTFTVHGVSRARSLDCLALADGDGWRVSCGFVVNLTDHDIEIPKIMFLKLAEDIRVELDFRLRPASTAQEEDRS